MPTNTSPDNTAAAFATLPEDVRRVATALVTLDVPEDWTSSFDLYRGVAILLEPAQRPRRFRLFPQTAASGEPTWVCPELRTLEVFGTAQGAADAAVAAINAGRTKRS